MPQAQYQFLLDLVNTRFESDLIARGLAAQDQPSTYDITNKVMEASVRRGRENELDPFGPGTMTLLLDNTDWRFTPDYGGSPLYGYLRPGAMVTARVPVPDYAGLVSWWTLDEAGASTRYDSYGTNHLGVSSAGTVTQAAGVVGNAAQFDGTSNYLTVASNASLQVGDIDFSVCGWVYLTSLASISTIACKWDTTGSNRQWYLYYYPTGNDFVFSVSSTGSDVITVYSSNVSLAVNTWYFVYAFHDAANNVIGISVNNGTIDTQSHALGVYASGTADVSIGGGVGGLLASARIDNFSFWKRVLPSVSVENVITVLLYDTFTDTDVTFLNLHTIAPTNTIGASWTALLGNAYIKTGRVRNNGGQNPDSYTYESSRSDVTITQDHYHGGSYTSNHVILRCTDNQNFWHVYTTATDNYWRIVERNTNVDTIRASAAKTINTSTVYAISVTASGATISATIDGGTPISYASATFNQTATKHGVGTRDPNNGAGIDNHQLSA